jgi:hypothetical protein
MKVKIDSRTFGDETRYPVVKSLVNILIESDNDKIYQYCATTIREYYEVLNQFNGLDKRLRIYVCTLIKEDFLNRLKTSPTVMLNKDVYTHMCNLITAIYRTKLAITNYHGQGIKKSNKYGNKI